MQITQLKNCRIYIDFLHNNENCSNTTLITYDCSLGLCSHCLHAERVYRLLWTWCIPKEHPSAIHLGCMCRHTFFFLLYWKAQLTSFPYKGMSPKMYTALYMFCFTKKSVGMYETVQHTVAYIWAILQSIYVGRFLHDQHILQIFDGFQKF